jgi:hypothetical protein
MTRSRCDAAGPPTPAGPLRPGDWVRHPTQPDWGTGQVQSVIGSRVTVSFEHAGKVMINIRHVALELVPD